MATADVGFIGLAVMGQNLVLNMADHDLSVAVYNRTVEKITSFVNGSGKGKNIVPCYSVEELVGKLAAPRKVMLMVKAGTAVDFFIDQVVQYLEPGDIVVDGGNSLYSDTERRCKHLAKKGILFIGTGISGGEEGARHGPSIMPGGNFAAWQQIKKVLQVIAAKVDGIPCCDWVGDGGAGHFVKMVHNGIEYGDMQLICEAYDLMSRGLGMETESIGEVFRQWNKGVLDSYLIEITAEIMSAREADGTPLLEKILDSAAQKGTGKWTGISALEKGVPLTMIGEAVFCRFLSTLKEERRKAAKVLPGPKMRISGDHELFIDDLHDALFGAKIVSYAQGYMLMRQAAKEHGWALNYGGIALMWRGGCIIRSAFLGNIKQAFEEKLDLENLLLDEFFRNAINHAQGGWRRVTAKAIEAGIPLPAMTAALAFYDGYRSETLPANLLQAQRDYFGAHTYERVDSQRGRFFHTDWSDLGGNVSSTPYET